MKPQIKRANQLIAVCVLTIVGMLLVANVAKAQNEIGLKVSALSQQPTSENKTSGFSDHDAQPSALVPARPFSCLVWILPRFWQRTLA